MRESSQATKTKLVEAARDLFLAHGYNATGISQILRTANVNSGSLYYFFPTKEDLLLGVLEWYRDHIEDDLIVLHTGHLSDPIEKIFGLLDGYRQLLKLFDFELGCPIGNLALEVANQMPSARQLLLVNFEQWLDAVQGFLDQATDRLPVELDTRQLAMHILATMEGSVMLARTYRSLNPFDQAISQLRDSIERLLADGSDWNAPRPPRSIPETLT